MECLKMLSIFKSPQHKMLFRFVHDIGCSNLKSPASKYVPPAILASEKKKKSFSKILLDYGFNQGQIDYIFNSPAGILGLNEKDLTGNLVNWCSFKVQDKLHTTLTSHAELLTLDPSYVNSRFTDLMTIFTKNDINKLLLTCPKVFLDDFDTIMDKMQYIVLNMKIEQKSIVKSYALQFDLKHIKCRHDFMVRSGHYKPVNKKVKSKNPPLSKIFSRNIETFLKLTRLTEEEYLVFCDAYEYEQSIKEDSDDEMDEDNE